MSAPVSAAPGVQTSIRVAFRPIGPGHSPRNFHLPVVHEEEVYVGNKQLAIFVLNSYVIAGAGRGDRHGITWKTQAFDSESSTQVDSNLVRSLWRVSVVSLDIFENCIDAHARHVHRKELQAGKTDQITIVGFDGSPDGKIGVYEKKLYDTGGDIYTRDNS